MREVEGMDKDLKRTYTGYFEINLKTGKTRFTYKCSTAYEALCAVEDVVNKGFIPSEDVNFDMFLHNLVIIQQEKDVRIEGKLLSIEYVVGKV